MPRDEHALPRRERSVQIGADTLDAAPERIELPLAGIGAWKGPERLDLLQESGNRFFEVEGF
jgi:hypothetical protein